MRPATAKGAASAERRGKLAARNRQWDDYSGVTRNQPTTNAIGSGARVGRLPGSANFGLGTENAGVC
jgi:hypothetical protein